MSETEEKVVSTPGTWELDSDGHVYAEVDPYEQDGYSPHICKVNMSRVDGAANAKLIKASPQMLVALKEALLALDGHRSMNSREIIAKAIEDAEVN